ncbi:MAG: 2-C-methyl-D-erythritol 4-phosphate cytidylyltransferase [Acidobacteria bacterium]|nr:2-C-methyl-D-erythritol 4-phosphate cytidylyltransferase [Acidobacteriota bacterium]
MSAVHVTAIIAAGGRGARFGGARPKQLLRLGGRPILERSVEAFLRHPRITDLIVAVPADVAAEPPEYLRTAVKPLTVVEGGARRQDSVARAFACLSAATDIVVVHDAARPLVTDAVIARTLDAAAEDGAAIAALPATDTVKRGDERRLIVGTVPRGEIYLAQTPQAFRTAVLREALARGDQEADATDEAALVERTGRPVRLVDGDPRNVKITTADDLDLAERLLGEGVGGPAVSLLRIGTGYDLHRLVEGRLLILGGVVIPFEKGLAGHSDADAVCHAVTDAILGAVAAGDIGRHFPDTDPRWKDADSLALLAHAVDMVSAAGYGVVNVDVVVIAERPKLAPHVDSMRANLARVLGITPAQVGIKGKTNEGVGSVGAGESIAVHAVALLNGVGGHFSRTVE